jgi:hypothetical protein
MVLNPQMYADNANDAKRFLSTSILCLVAYKKNYKHERG